MKYSMVFKPSFTLPFFMTLIMHAEKNDNMDSTNMANILKLFISMLSPEK